ncbi:MAG: HDIG domain-containing protein, partial [Chloroflexi bacterium]|nr:HDIG domain-containing protein [Chloroflexota bacterium]
MTQRAPAGRAPARASRLDAGLLTFGAVAAVALLAALFPWFTGGPRLEEGRVVERPIVAPRDVSYDSVVLTTREREARAAAVRSVFVLDTDVRERQLAALDQALAATARVRDNQTLARSAKETAIRAIPGVEVSTRSAAALVDLTAEQWRALGDEVRNALGRTLTQSIAEGEVGAARVRAAGYLSPLLMAGQVVALQELINPLIVPTLVVDSERTELLREEAMANTPAVRVTFARGEVVVAAGRELTAADVEALDRLGARRAGIQPTNVVAAAAFASLAGAALAGYVGVVRPRALRGARRRTLFLLLVLAPVVAAKFTFPVLLPDLDRHFIAYGLPLAATPIAAAVLLDPPAAIVVALLTAASAVFLSTILPTVDAGGEAAQLETARLALAVLAGSLAGIYAIARADRLQRYLVAGAASAATVAGALVIVWLLDPDRRLVDLPWIAGASAVGGLLASLIAVGAFVLLSRPFGIITRVELMELAQLHHPLLRRLQDEAPGTFHHAILVGNMAERAADRIGADPLLVRVGAYYHDIGKLVAPEFFVENTAAGVPSPHDGLDPLQSTRVIQQHVSAGIELGRRAGLPEAVVRFIPEHHGTRLVVFFYRRAAEADPQIDEDLFRYPGPKPQSREAALVMIADGCEATVRASADQSAQRIRAIVEETIKERIEEGEFDECDISLRDLRVVAESFTGTLAAVFHGRVGYPEPTERERARRAGAARPTSEAPRPR